MKIFLLCLLVFGTLGSCTKPEYIDVVIDDSDIIHFNQGICSVDISNLVTIMHTSNSIHMVYEGGCKEILKSRVLEFSSEIWKIDFNIEFLDEVFYAFEELNERTEITVEIWSDNMYTLSSEEIDTIISSNMIPFFGKGIGVSNQDEKDMFCSKSILGCLELEVIE